MNERSTASQEDGQRGGRRSGRRRPKAPEVQPTSNRGARSGAYNILTSQDIDRVHSAALDVLERVGFSEAPDSTRDYLRGAGCTETETGRILFPRAVVEDALARANRSLVLHGQKPEHDVLLEDSRTYFSTGSASFVVVDPQNRTTRPTTLRDIFDFARMADALEHIHLFHRVGSPQDLGGIEEIDFNLCYAAVSGTSKPVMTNWFDGANLPRSLDMLHTMAGGEAQWRARPFVTNACAFTVSPLKFAGDSCIGLEHAVRGGMPVQLICAPQMGATAPVSVVGTLVQAVAELMAGVVYSLAVSPDARIFLGFWALVTDLRTGAAATGSPEHILLAAALSRMSRFYGIPNGVPSGIADAKMHDVQAGAERGMQHGLIANAGGNILFSSSGTLASGMGVSHAGLVIDNDIAGAALRTLSGISTDGVETAVEEIASVCLSGEGHYLGQATTLSEMKSGFFYPRTFDRSSIKDWTKTGARTALDTASEIVDQILSEYYPTHVSPETDDLVRAAHDVKLDRSIMVKAGA